MSTAEYTPMRPGDYPGLIGLCTAIVSRRGDHDSLCGAVPNCVGLDQITHILDVMGRFRME